MDRHTKYAILAACLLSVGVVIEASRLLLNAPWPGFAPWISHLVSAVFCSLWAITAVSLFLRHRSVVAGRVAWVGSCLAPFLMFLHAAITRTGGSSVSFVYVPLAVLLGLSLTRVWDRGERLSDADAESESMASARV